MANEEQIKRAEELYQQGKKLVEIAAELGRPEGTIRRWKSTYGWDGERSKKSSERSGKKSERSVWKELQKDKELSEEIRLAAENDELTDKQRLFCVLYTKCFNATKAYQKAYDCDYNTAMVNGSRMLRIAKVKEMILFLKQNRMDRELFSEEDIFQKYMDIAFADITDYVEFGREEVQVMAAFGPVMVKDEKTGKKVPLTKKINSVRLKESTEVDGSIISEVKQGSSGVSVKLADRMKALQWLSDHLDQATEEQKKKLEDLL